MANDFTTNPWILDTAGLANGYEGGNVFVDHMEMTGYTQDTDTCLVVNLNGREVWAGNGASDLEEVRSGKIGVVNNGLYLSQISSGKVRVYIR